MAVVYFLVGLATVAVSVSTLWGWPWAGLLVGACLMAAGWAGGRR